MADLSIVTDNCLEESDEAYANKQTSPNGLGFPPRQSRWRSDQMELFYSTGVYEQGDGNSVGDSGDEALTPVLRIQKHAYSENVYDRKSVCRILLDLFKLAPMEALTNDLPAIMNIIVEMVEEDEVIVRTDIMEQIPNLASLAMSCSSRVPVLENITSEYLLPVVVRNLGTNDNQMRQTAHSTLFALMEKGLVSKAQAEIQVCPTVLALSRKECITYYHSGVVTLMSKMVPLLGKDVTERVFLDRFAELCSNETFYVRKMCASHIGEFCAIVGKPAFERVLLPTFVELCKDQIWGVRKACADVVVLVSCVCSPSMRKTVLAPAFTKLLQDDCRWVRISAFHMLGPFISTFAEPTITSLGYNNLGELVLIDANGSEFKVNCSTTFLTGEVKGILYLTMSENNSSEDFDAFENLIGCDSLDWKSNTIENGMLEIEAEKKDQVEELPVEDVGDHVFPEEKPIGDTEIENNEKSTKPDILKQMYDSFRELWSTTACTDENEWGEEGKDADGLELYNSYNYWYVPPDMPLDPSIVDAGRPAETSLNDSANEQVVIPPPESDNTVLETKEPIDSTIDKATEIDNLLAQALFIEETETQNSSPKDKSKAKNDNNSEIQNLSPEVKIESNLEVENSSPEVENLSLEVQNLSLEAQNSSPEVQINAENDSNSSEKSDDLGVNLEDDRLRKCMMECLNAAINNSSSTVPLNSTFNVNETDKEQPKEDEKEQDPPPPEQPQQTVVPQNLIDYFIKMTEVDVAQNTDDSVAFHCAYSFPAVALTLGRNNWFILKDTMEKLAANMQYKIRRTIAMSLHRLASILGPDMASDNLTPIFSGFIKDLDEVRIGVVKHLAHFLQIISPTKRTFFSQRLLYFLKNHQELNWRYRYELVEQLSLSVTLFTPNEASKHISVIAQRLLCDKVSAVRQITIQLVMELLKHISSEPGLTNPLLVRFAEKFAHSKKWKFRQTFVVMCAEMLRTEALPMDQFTSEVQEHLLDLSWDPVANVRLMVAETILKHMITNEHFVTVPEVVENLRRLQSDKDRDVRLAAQGHVGAPTSFLDNTSPTNPIL